MRAFGENMESAVGGMGVENNGRKDLIICITADPQDSSVVC